MNAEYEVDRACDEWQGGSVTLYTVTAETEEKIRRALDWTAVESQAGPELALREVREVLADFRVVPMPKCPFEGTVTLFVAGGTAWWECPVCRHRHDEVPS